jgi:hypothetical protein
MSSLNLDILTRLYRLDEQMMGVNTDIHMRVPLYDMELPPAGPGLRRQNAMHYNCVSEAVDVASSLLARPRTSQFLKAWYKDTVVSDACVATVAAEMKEFCSVLRNHLYQHWWHGPVTEQEAQLISVIVFYRLVPRGEEPADSWHQAIRQLVLLGGWLRHDGSPRSFELAVLMRWADEYYDNLMTPEDDISDAAWDERLARFPRRALFSIAVALMALEAEQTGMSEEEAEDTPHYAVILARRVHRTLPLIDFYSRVGYWRPSAAPKKSGRYSVTANFLANVLRTEVEPTAAAAELLGVDIV